MCSTRLILGDNTGVTERRQIHLHIVATRTYSPKASILFPYFRLHVPHIAMLRSRVKGKGGRGHFSSSFRDRRYKVYQINSKSMCKKTILKFLYRIILNAAG